MPKIIFISQEQMEKYTMDGTADISSKDVVLRLDRTYTGTFEEAYYFLRNVVNINDQRNLIGRVLTKDEISKLNADIMPNSIIIENDAYDVEEGFMIFEEGATEQKATKKEKGSRTQELKSLASFILDSLKTNK